MKFLDFFKKNKKEIEQKDDLREILKDKYLTFQNLLRENNHVLSVMADMEEKLSGEYLFDRHYLNTSIKSISDGVLRIIENLNALSHGRYKELYMAYDDIYKEIKNILSHKSTIPVSDLTIPIEELKGDPTNIAGGKIAHLGEIKNCLNLPTPDGFSISAYAFKRFMEHNNFREKINEKLSSVHIENMDEINEISKEIQDMVIRAEIPEDLENAIKNAVEGLKVSDSRFTVHGSRLMVSVRSSAIHEDGEFSFAGQYATFLNVPEDLILQRYKEVVASLFTPRAIFYYKTKGFSEEEMVMSVGVLKMIDAKAGGVIYTRDPNDPEKDTVIINADWGLGKVVVDGTVEPNSYIVSRDDGIVLEKKVPEQQAMFVCALEGDIREVNVPDEIKRKPCLTDGQIKMLSEYASMLEKHYGKPQDIEWAIDQDNQIYILQTRPLRRFKIQDSKFKIPRKIEGYNLIIDKGVIACKGIGYGKAFILKDEDNLKDFPEGAVLVAKHTSTKFVTVMNKASAIITDIGGTTAHMATLAREYQVPTILDARVATTLIKDGQEITVDAFNCNVYEGRIDEILKFTAQRSTFRDIPLFRTLKMVFNRIAPLNLVSPEYKNFTPEYCKTFHDITRFAHEKAMSEMFSIGTEHAIDNCPAVPLKAGIPLDVHLIDLGGGLRENITKATLGDILSIPFSVFLKGMMAMRWPEPRPADVKGFLGMIAHTASIPEGELRETAGHSYAILSRNYMNFSIKLGYHFSMVEAYAGENINDNYIKFSFKGGGATTDRRMRRIRLITEILKKMGFTVDVRGDVMDAVLPKFRRSDIEKRLEAMGKLTAYTKQLDMAMYNDDVTDMFIEDFVRDHIKQ